MATDALRAAEAILRDAGSPLHYRDITQQALTRRLWSSDSKTPEATMNARLAVDIQERGADSRFRRVSPGVFTLREASVSLRVRKVRESSPRAPSSDSKKLSVSEIRDVARQIVKDRPEGIRYGQLLAMILDEYPRTPRNGVSAVQHGLERFLGGPKKAEQADAPDEGRAEGTR